MHTPLNTLQGLIRGSMADFVLSPCSTIWMNTDIKAYTAFKGQPGLYFLVLTGAVIYVVLLLKASAKRIWEQIQASAHFGLFL